jgi:hypothetical protein
VRAQKLLRLFFAVPLLLFSLAAAPAQSAPGGAPLLPEKVGDFRAQGKSAPADLKQFAPEDFGVEDFGVVGAETRSYAGADGERFTVILFKTRSAAAAYSLLRFSADASAPARVGALGGSGVLGIEEPERVRFIKGDGFADVRAASEQAKNGGALPAFAKSLADALEGDAGFVPVLVLHLPEWEKKVNEDVGYAVSLPALQRAAGGRPVLDAIDFDKGTEAVTAAYAEARLVVVEFPTPQHSVDADARIGERIAQLRAAGEPVPSAYKRVGNYSVFVFDAPDTASAEKLISGVKYEKDVRWLGRNPHAEENAIRRYTSTMGGVIMTTLVTTGLAILLSLGVGGAIGGAVFLYRRSRQTTQEIYSDAGGMMRLNIEDLNTPPPAAKLLGHGEE